VSGGSVERSGATDRSFPALQDLRCRERASISLSAATRTP
jgi:hypothetical protein